MIKYKNKKYFSYIKTLQLIKIINYFKFLKQLNIIFKRFQNLSIIYSILILYKKYKKRKCLFFMNKTNKIKIISFKFNFWFIF